MLLLLVKSEAQQGPSQAVGPASGIAAVNSEQLIVP